MRINGISTNIDDGTLDIPLANGVSPSLYHVTAIKDLSKFLIIDNLYIDKTIYSTRKTSKFGYEYASYKLKDAGIYAYGTSLMIFYRFKGGKVKLITCADVIKYFENKSEV
jgi:hypothetical protein